MHFLKSTLFDRKYTFFEKAIRTPEIRSFSIVFAGGWMV